jgi:serine/threonine kinase 32
MDWDALENKTAQPLFVPDMNQANFDVSHELDEFLMVEKPLTHSKRKANPDLEKMKPELRQLEEQYVFDTASLDLLMDFILYKVYHIQLQLLEPNVLLSP